MRKQEAWDLASHPTEGGHYTPRKLVKALHPIARFCRGSSRRQTQARLTELNAVIYDACWSPDGKRIAYVWHQQRVNPDQDDPVEFVLSVTDPDGKNPVTPDGERERSRRPMWIGGKTYGGSLRRWMCRNNLRRRLKNLKT